MKTKYALFIFIFFIVSLQSFAVTWQTFAVSSGLPSANTTAFTYNSKWMAVGTDKGIALYNGDTCEWNVPTNLPNEVASASVKDMAFDRHGNLWLATSLGLIHYQQNTVIVYDGSKGLPTIDINRIQVVNNKIYVGCFGGYVCSAFIPVNGSTSFVPVNYDDGFRNETLKIRSVGVSGLGMLDDSTGWISTKGQGMVNIVGSNQYYLNCINDGLISDWVNDFWLFKDKQRETKMVVGGNDGFSLITDGKVIKNYKLPEGGSWITAIATLKNNPETMVYQSDHEYTKDEIFLAKYLKSRSLFIGTRNSGLWKFQAGIWTHYNAENSDLQSNHVNRLFTMGRNLVVLTDRGMAIVPVDSQQYDEFAKVGLGNKYAKTIYAMPPNFSYMIPFKQVLKTKDYWFSHMHGLTRYKTTRYIKHLNLDETQFQSGRVESAEDEEKQTHSDKKQFVDFPSVKKKLTGSALHWQMFTNEYMSELNPEVIQPILSEKITKLGANKGSKYIWLIFDNETLCRMNIEIKDNPWSKTKDKVDIANWEYPKNTPWTKGTKLTTVWGNGGHIYVGTIEDGFYILKNPDAKNDDKEPFEWKHYGTYDGLPLSTVTGFTNWKTKDDEYLVIMHATGVSLWNRENFSPLDLGGRRHYTCITSDDGGNLWLGSDGGLFRVDKNYKVYSFTIGNAQFESNYITAIGVPPRKSGSDVEIYVACDELANFTELSDNFNGSDQPPNVRVFEVDSRGHPIGEITSEYFAHNGQEYQSQFQTYQPTLQSISSEADHTSSDGADSEEDESGQRYIIKKITELFIEGSSFHYYNGRTWEKWRIAGVRSMFMDGDYIWITSNIRVRRLMIPR